MGKRSGRLLLALVLACTYLGSLQMDVHASNTSQTEGVALKAEVTGPATSPSNKPISYTLKTTNTGTQEVVVKIIGYPPGGADPMIWENITITPGESFSETVVITLPPEIRGDVYFNMTVVTTAPEPAGYMTSAQTKTNIGEPTAVTLETAWVEKGTVPGQVRFSWIMAMQENVVGFNVYHPGQINPLNPELIAVEMGNLWGQEYSFEFEEEDDLQNLGYVLEIVGSRNSSKYGPYYLPAEKLYLYLPVIRR